MPNLKEIKPEYMIVNEGADSILYRKLWPGEEIWYEEEVHRLRTLDGELWLRLKKCKPREIVDKVAIAQSLFEILPSEIRLEKVKRSLVEVACGKRER